jgi:hypothetical protein
MCRKPMTSLHNSQTHSPKFWHGIQIPHLEYPAREWYLKLKIEIETEIEIEKIRNLIKIKHTLVRASFTKRVRERTKVSSLHSRERVF